MLRPSGGADDEELAGKGGATPRDVSPEETNIGFHAYFLLCLVAASVPCFLTVALWSQMGLGEECMDFLDERQELAKYCAGFVAMLFVVLYLLDFFCPPHMPGEFLRLFREDPIVRFLIMGLIGLGMLGVSLLSAKEYPYLPTLATVLCGPALAAAVRCATTPRHGAEVSGRPLKCEEALRMIVEMARDELDTRTFYSGAMVAFLVSGGLQVLVWVLWAMSTELEGPLELGNLEHERRYIRYLAPLIVGLANVAFGLMAVLRVMLADDYQDFRDVRVDLICKEEDSTSLDSTEAIVARALKTQGTMEAFKQLSVKDQQLFAKEEIHTMMKVCKTVKVIGCCFLTLLGCVYVAAELVAADSHLAQFVLGFVGVCFMCFVAFLFASFGRLISSTRDWFVDCPLGRCMLALSDNDWVRAFAIFAVLPAVPALLGLSVVNQFVRRCRGLYTRIPPRQVSAFEQRAAEAPAGASGHRASHCSLSSSTAVEVSYSPEDQLLTERFMLQIEAIRTWDRVSVVSKLFLINLALVCYILSPRFLNVGLSWLSGMLLSGVPFGATVAIVIASGLVCFLLPPVPGLPVYLFCGVIISKVCPYGYWPGCFLAVGVGLVLKLTACSMQQKLIGEVLGSSLWIRSQVGVNKPFFRAVERILRQPGLTWGKVAILCGGPDWPTSVLTGLLRCSLLQMELGTLPIIVFIMPCTLCGCFYVRVAAGQFWTNAMNLMVALSMAINMIFGVGALWAVQEELDAHHWEVTRPLEKYIDLDWLDYRSAQIAHSCVVQWQDVPCAIRVLALAGALLEVAVGHALYWCSGACFGTFNITDDIATLVWFGDNGLFKPQGVLGLDLTVLGFAAYVVLVVFIRKEQSLPAALKAERLEACEEAWKLERAFQAQVAQQAPAPSAAELLRRASVRRGSGRASRAAASERAIAKE